MKKIFSILAILFFALSFSQTYVKVISQKDQLEKSYKGGQDNFNKDLSSNLQQTGSLFQVTGDFKLNFKVDENGDISNVRVLPELFDNSFEREVKRDVLRMKKHFVSNQEQNVSVDLNFSRNIPDQDGRAFLTYSQSTVNSR